MDRVPIEQATDKVEPTQETPPTPGISGNDKGLSEMQDLQDMSVMFGFEAPGFDGMGKEAETIYGWAREANPENPLEAVKTALDISGIVGNNRELMSKLNRWVKLDGQMANLERRKMLIQ